MRFLAKADTHTLTQKTIEDFGEQWERYQDNSGYYGSLDLFKDILGPLVAVEELQDLRVADIGSGTGRIVGMLIEAGAAHVLAVEPSDAFAVLERNVRHYGARVQLLRARGEEIPSDLQLDFVLSIGVLHHIPDPAPVMRAAYGALKPEGKIVIWVYSKEGNETYLSFVRPLRIITPRLPHRLLIGLSSVLCLVLDVYILAARVLPIPMHDYVRGTLARLTRDKRRLVVYDQLNPAYAKYYGREEVIALLQTSGFEGISLYHRHGNSWTAMGHKPSAPEVLTGPGCKESVARA